MKDNGLYILLISIHGLIRGVAPELGRDPDTGGQVLYVLELAKALARHQEVAQVDLLTRLVQDPRVPEDYAQPEEELAPHARIIRLPFGPRRYIRKEALWAHLDHLADRYLLYAKQLPRLPDLIHSHYADAGYVASHLSSLLGIPFLHTGHSLGQCKRAKLLQAGGSEAHLERIFRFTQRIQAEEDTLAQARAVVASTRQEVHEQYALYSNFNPRRAAVIPPGTDTSRFRPPRWRFSRPQIARQVDRFLADPRKPLLLCIARPDSSKNLQGLLQAFGEDRELRAQANLLLVAGNREDIRMLDDASRRTWEELLLTVDRYDLFGSVAIPKNHEPADIPEFYQLAAQRKGLYVNPAFSESFGLTLIEAAASGLPVVSTENGGPKDIIANCRNGLLMNPADPAAIRGAIREALSNRKRWSQWARNGLRGVRDFYTWDAHVDRYLKVAKKVLRKDEKRRRKELASTEFLNRSSPFLHASHVLICDLDDTLLGDPISLGQVVGWMVDHPSVAFGIATGRGIDSARWALGEWSVPEPDVLITSVGSEIHYGATGTRDGGWDGRIRQGWRREELAQVMKGVPGLSLQAARKQGPYKLSYHVNPNRFPGLDFVCLLIQQAGLQANPIFSQARFLDLLPPRASKGQALRYLAFKWGIPLDHFLVAGDSGNDRDMLEGDMLGIVVANHSAEIEHLRGRPRIYFANQSYAAGILEGLRHYSLRSRASEALTGTHD